MYCNCKCKCNECTYHLIPATIYTFHITPIKSSPFFFFFFNPTTVTTKTTTIFNIQQQLTAFTVFPPCILKQDGPIDRLLLAIESQLSSLFFFFFSPTIPLIQSFFPLNLRIWIQFKA